MCLTSTFIFSSSLLKVQWCSRLESNLSLRGIRFSRGLSVRQSFTSTALFSRVIFWNGLSILRYIYYTIYSQSCCPQSQQLIIFMKICEHYSSLKHEKVANFIKQAGSVCSNKAKHPGKPAALWLCLVCGFLGCGRYSELKCAAAHNEESKHKLSMSVENADVFCYECDESYSEIVERCESENLNRTQSASFERLKEFREKVEVELYKASKKIEQQPFFMQKTSKKVTYSYGVDDQNDKKSSQDYMQVEKQPTLKLAKNKTLKYHVFGLNNLGNTCFFNSIMQSLYATRPLHQNYTVINFTKQCQESQPMQQVQNKFDQLEEKYHVNGVKEVGSGAMSINQRFKKYLVDAGNTHTFNPSEVFSSVGAAKSKFKSMAQQDAQELLRYLIDALNEGEIYQLGINRTKMKSVEKKQGKLKLTYIEHIFGSYLASRLHCLSCQNVSWTFDLCLDLSIEILRDKNIEHPIMPSKKEIPEGEIKMKGLFYPDKDIKIPNLLFSFFAPQTLTKQNYFSCEKCKASKAVKKLYIKDPPQILTIVIKRFTNGLQKNNSQVDFPYELNLAGASITPGNWIYRVYAVVVHQGSVYGGHYIAYTRRGQTWYYFSDSHSKQTTWDSVKNCQAYILFYELLS